MLSAQLEQQPQSASEEGKNVPKKRTNDFNSKELLEILKTVDEDDEIDDNSGLGYAKKILFEMMPSPENLADLAAMGE